MCTSPPPHRRWNRVLPGPPNRNNAGAADCSSAGLLAYATGSCVAVVDTRSMQLVSVLPMPAPSATSLAAYVTAVRWSPETLHCCCRDVLSGGPPPNSHLLLAAGDRHGRIALWDFQLNSIVRWIDGVSVHPLSPEDGCRNAGVQDLCWVRAGLNCTILGAIKGASLVSLWNALTGECVWKFDASPEIFSCIRRDPFDFRHFCVLGMKGFLFSVKVLGEREEDVVVREHWIPVVLGEFDELWRLEKGKISTGSSFSPPVLVMFPQFVVRFCFVPMLRGIVIVMFPKELVVFDLEFKSSLSSVRLPRGCRKFLDVVPDINNNFLYCAHVDGKLSIWRRQQGEQGYTMCKIEELIPSIGTSIPYPKFLSLILSQSETFLQRFDKLYINTIHTSSHSVDHGIPSGSCRESLPVSKTYLISISDDGKIWSWLLTAKVNECEPSEIMKGNNICSGPPNSILLDEHLLFEMQISLVGQLHLLSSTVTVLAVPPPTSVPCLALPLVALGSQSGMVDIIDISAKAVAARFSVHSSNIRGLRWLGNSRFVSFSYNQVNEKPGGYTNRLVVSDLSSGHNQTFRFLQKPEHAPVRALRASSSGRYLFILINDAPLEIWSMKRNPIMLRSLALPFTALEWTLKMDPWEADNGHFRQSLPSSKEHIVAAIASSNSPSVESNLMSSKGSSDEISESFAFALVNGALGVFEICGKKIQDFRPKRPFSSFGSFAGPVNAVAYRFPHIVLGDRTGNISWWNVRTGFSSSFNTRREGIRRIKLPPFVTEGSIWGCIAVLFYDNTFAIFDLDSEDPLANSFLQPHFPGTLVLEIEWLHLETDKNEPQVLCIAGADSSFRLIEVNINNDRKAIGSKQRLVEEKFRPMPLCSPVLLPMPHALALKMIIQLGEWPFWLDECNVNKHWNTYQNLETVASNQELRFYTIDSLLPPVGDPVALELLHAVLEPYQREGCIFDDERAEQYATVANRSSTMRFAFTAAIFGELSEALFWIQLPSALSHMMNKSGNISPQKSSTLRRRDIGCSSSSSMIPVPRERKKDKSYGHFKPMAFEEDKLWEIATEAIPWHEKLEGEEAIQKHVHELVSIGNLEAAVSLLLSGHPEGSYFYSNALRAIVLSAAVSKSLLEFSIKIVATNMVRTDKSLSATHLLCAVGRYQEACSQLQDAGHWTDAATLGATYLQGPDYSRVLHRWADHVLRNEHDIWRALILYVAAGELVEVLKALKDAEHPETAIMFLYVLHETNAENKSYVGNSEFIFPCLSPDHADVTAIGRYYEQYQRKLLKLCIDTQAVFI